MQRGVGVAVLAACVACPVAGSASPGAEMEASLLMQLSRAQGALDQGAARGRPAFGATAAPRLMPTLPERRALEPLAEAAAQQHGVSVSFFKRLIGQESGYNPHAISTAGAQGIAQFMPATAMQVGLDDPFDPAKALPKSAAHLADLQRRLGNEGLAAAAYNAGEGRVRAWLAGRSGLPMETQNYVRSITGRFAHEWAPSGAVLRSTADDVALPGTRPSRMPAFARLSGGEWQLGIALTGGQSRLTALLEAGGRRGGAPRPVQRAAAPAALTGEKALCASMGRGCIVAAVY